MNNPKNYWDSIVQGNSLYQMGPQSHRIYLLDLLREKGVKSVFDVGCGTGPIWQLIRDDLNETVQGGEPVESARWNFKYKGTDYSEGMIESCKFNFPEGDFEVQDARHLLEKDNSWDCVLLMHSLDHLDDYEAAIKEAARVAKKYVLIVLWRGINYKDDAQNNLNSKNRYGKDESDPNDWEDTHLQDFAWNPLKKAFKDAKLKIALKEDGPEVNKEGRYNTVILLEK